MATDFTWMRIETKVMVVIEEWKEMVSTMWTKWTKCRRRGINRMDMMF